MNSSLRKAVMRLRALLDPVQRNGVFCQWLRNFSPETIVEILQQALLEIGKGNAEPSIIIDVFHSSLDSGGVDYETRATLYALASEQGHHDLARLLLPPPSWVFDEAKSALPKASFAAIGKPLGTRTWLARRCDRDGIDKLIRDPEKTVIENLLLNPLLTEDDVLRIVAHRPNDPQLIAVIGRSAKWNRRYRLRRAMVFNPYCSVDLASRQIAFMTRADLLAIATDPKLHPNLRDSAKALAAQRPPTRTLEKE